MRDKEKGLRARSRRQTLGTQKTGVMTRKEVTIHWLYPTSPQPLLALRPSSFLATGGWWLPALYTNNSVLLWDSMISVKGLENCKVQCQYDIIITWFQNSLSNKTQQNKMWANDFLFMFYLHVYFLNPGMKRSNRFNLLPKLNQKLLFRILIYH